MGGLTGWITFDHGAIVSETIHSMSSRLRFAADSHEQVFSTGGCAVTAVAAPAMLDFHQEPGAMAIILGSPSFGKSSQGTGAAKQLIEAVRRDGPSALESLHGRYVLAVILEQEKQALLAVDRAAVYPLAYAVTPNGITFGSNTDSVIAHTVVSREIDPQQIFNYLYLHVIPSPGSIYRNVHRLGPGQYLWWRDNRCETGHYWRPVYSREDERLEIQPLAEEFRGLLRSAVSQQLGKLRVGAFLSGGTDSSTVAGLLGEMTGEMASTYSIGFDAEGYDEMEYARIAARHFGTRHHEYYVTPEDVASAIPQIARIHSEPFGNSSAVPTYYCARLARADGIERLLAGDGGDELFGGNARYATQYLFSLYGCLPERLRRGLIEPAVFRFPDGDHIYPLRKLRGYIRQANMPMPQRLESYNLLERIGIEKILAREFLDQIDPKGPMMHLSEVYHGAHAETMLNRMLALDHKLTLADNDLPKVGRSCELAGVDVAYPMLTDDLMAFAERLPVRLKLKGVRLRYFFKEALRDFLPREILAKRKHGFGLPYGPWVLKNRVLREITYDSLSDISKRRIVQPAFIEQLMDRYLPEHPGFYGSLAWILVMLEQWYRQHGDPSKSVTSATGRSP